MSRPLPVWSPEMVNRIRQMAESGMSDVAIAKEFGRVRWVVEAVRRRNNIKSHFSNAQREIPTDLSEVAPTMTIAALAERYQSSTTTVRKWLHKVGVEPGKRIYARREPVAKVARVSRPVWGASPLAPVPSVDPTLEGRAAQHLRHYFIPVCRLRTIRPSAPEGIWVVGRNQVDTPTLIEMAEAKGFDAYWATKVAA